jgi:hypothetical protein
LGRFVVTFRAEREPRRARRARKGLRTQRVPVRLRVVSERAVPRRGSQVRAAFFFLVHSASFLHKKLKKIKKNKKMVATGFEPATSGA